MVIFKQPENFTSVTRHNQILYFFFFNIVYLLLFSAILLRKLNNSIWKIESVIIALFRFPVNNINRFDNLIGVAHHVMQSDEWHINHSICVLTCSTNRSTKKNNFRDYNYTTMSGCMKPEICLLASFKQKKKNLEAILGPAKTPPVSTSLSLNANIFKQRNYWNCYLLNWTLLRMGTQIFHP